MEGGAGRGLECQKTMDGKVNNGNSSEKAIPSCCLKAKASAPELDAICHSTVVSGWFSESHSCSGHYLFLLLLFLFLILGILVFVGCYYC
jgi:spermidine synthase